MLAICIAAHCKYYWAGFDPTRLNSAPALLDSSERSVLFPLPKPSNLFCSSGSKCALCPHHIKAWQCCNGHCTPLTRKAVLENQFWSLHFLIRVSSTLALYTRVCWPMHRNPMPLRKYCKYFQGPWAIVSPSAVPWLCRAEFCPWSSSLCLSGC